ncbi:hypothetical protein JCGZ_22762 [Jatropha curcas]|uniref:Uncharacterized protein n=1 Tax=Jatropha curcas TaxID=180498 RepID=A0A067LFG2_JATCU|nr:hypothetical protein JCGZ_22762 [Jatropha curcas]
MYRSKIGFDFRDPREEGIILPLGVLAGVSPEPHQTAAAAVVHSGQKSETAQKIVRSPLPNSNFREESKSAITLLSQCLVWPDLAPQPPSSRRPWCFVKTQATSQINGGGGVICRSETNPST